jgi:hypothetical protein
VRRDPKGMGDRGTVELTEGGGGRWHDGGSSVGWHGHEAEEERRGVMRCSGTRSRGRTRGKEKRGAVTTGALYRRCGGE